MWSSAARLPGRLACGAVEPVYKLSVDFAEAVERRGIEILQIEKERSFGVSHWPAWPTLLDKAVTGALAWRKAGLREDGPAPDLVQGSPGQLFTVAYH
jgi:hypothetical protein